MNMANKKQTNKEQTVETKEMEKETGVEEQEQAVETKENHTEEHHNEDKNDKRSVNIVEFEALKKENVDLRKRIAELEKQIADNNTNNTSSIVYGVSIKTYQDFFLSNGRAIRYNSAVSDKMNKIKNEKNVQNVYFLINEKEKAEIYKEYGGSLKTFELCALIKN